ASLGRLEALDPADYDELLSPRLLEMPDREIHRWSKLVTGLLRPSSWIFRMNPFRMLKRRSLRKFLVESAVVPDAATMNTFAQALSLETALRPERAVIAGVCSKLSELPRLQTLVDLRRAASDLLKAIRAANNVMARIAEHPLAEVTETIAREGMAS